jgi:hypothetical protein
MRHDVDYIFHHEIRNGAVSYRLCQIVEYFIIIAFGSGFQGGVALV